jgi:hypothetical protein
MDTSYYRMVGQYLFALIITWDIARRLKGRGKNSSQRIWKGGEYGGKERGYLLTADLTPLQKSERVSFTEKHYLCRL